MLHAYSFIVWGANCVLTDGHGYREPRVCDIPITKNAKSLRYNFRQREKGHFHLLADSIVAGR